MAICNVCGVGDSWRNTMDYIADEEKADWRIWESRFPGIVPNQSDPVILIQGIHCDPWTAKEEFAQVYRQFSGDQGIRVIHIMISFKGKNASPWDVQRLGMELIRTRYGERYQAVVATHLNTSNLHFHAAVNKVPFTGGKKIHDQNMYALRYEAENLARKYHVEEESKGHRLRYPYYRDKETLGYPTDRNLLRHTVDALIPCSRSLDELFTLLEHAGYRYYVNNAGAWVTVRSTDGRRLTLDCLGPDYLPDALREKIRSCRETRPLRPPEWTDPGWKLYPFPRREDLLAKRTEPSGLWLRARCAAGYLPVYRARMGKVAPLALRTAVQDMRNVEKETSFLSRHAEISFGALSARDTVLTEQIRLLTRERDKYYLRTRSGKPTGEKKEEAREMVRQLSDRMAPLRNELRMIRAVKKRYPVLTELLGETENGVLIPEQEKNRTEKEVALE